MSMRHIMALTHRTLQTPDEERRKLLSFVVVGGGPTGVEVAAEMYDMIHEDLRDLYPDLIKDVRIRVVELMDHVLSTYDRKIGEYTAKLFKRQGMYVHTCNWQQCNLQPDSHNLCLESYT